MLDIGRRRLSLALALLALLAGADIARADVECEFNGGAPPTLEITVTDGTAAHLVRNGINLEVSDFMGPKVCTGGPATVNNTDVVLVADQSAAALLVSFGLHLSGGSFTPGPDDETGTTDELEFSIQGIESFAVTGSTGNDGMRLGAGTGTGAMNLNATSENLFNGGFDSDLEFSGLEQFLVYAGVGNDVVGGQGAAGTGAAFELPMYLRGQDGDDDLTGGAASDQVGDNVEPGDDILTGGGGDDVLSAEAADDVVTGGGGSDVASYLNAPGGVTVDLAITAQQNTGAGGLDTLSQVEAVFGGGFNDTLLGNSASNALTGSGGDDVLDGRSGPDTLVGDASFAFGADRLLLRDGETDTANCGQGAFVDVVEADLPGVDSISSDCEQVDFLQAPLPADTTPPETIGFKGPRNIDHGRRAKFRFSSSEPDSTFRCKLDRRAYAACTSPRRIKTKKLDTDSKHRFRVFAVDPAGNQDPTPAKRRFRVLD